MYGHYRKGWLFSDTVKGAVASANLYSLVETAGTVLIVGEVIA